MRHKVDLILEDGSSLELKLDDLFPFVIDRSVAEIQELTKRKTNGSKTFKIPATVANNRALAQCYELSVSYRDIQEAIWQRPVHINVDGVVMESGYITVRSVVIGSDGRPEYYEANYLGSDLDWIERLRLATMRDVYGQVSVIYQEPTIRSLNQNPDVITWCNPYTFKFLDVIDAAGGVANVTADDMWPAARMSWLVGAILDDAGIAWSSDFLNDSAWWDNIYYSDRSLKNEDGEDYDVQLGNSYSIGQFFSPKDSQLDFFVGFLQTFNCVAQYRDGVLTFEPRFGYTDKAGTFSGGFYQDSQTEDWNSRVSRASEVEFKTRYKQRETYRWASDSNCLHSGEMQRIESNVLDLSEVFTFGGSPPITGRRGGTWYNDETERVIEFGPGFERGENETEFYFNYTWDLGYYAYERYDRADQDNLWSRRVFLYEVGNVYPVAGASFLVFNTPIVYEDQSSTTHNLTQWSCWQYLGPNRLTTLDSGAGFLPPVENISFRINQGLGAISPDSPSLWEKLFETTIDKIARGRTLEASVNLSIQEYMGLSMRTYVIIDGQKFVINKLKEFDPFDDGPTTIQLLKIE